MTAMYTDQATGRAMLASDLMSLTVGVGAFLSVAAAPPHTKAKTEWATVLGSGGVMASDQDGWRRGGIDPDRERLVSRSRQILRERLAENPW